MDRAVAVGGLLDFLGLEPVMANHEDTSVQVRHLRAHKLVVNLLYGAFAIGTLTVCHQDRERRPWEASWAPVQAARSPVSRLSLSDLVPWSLFTRAIMDWCHGGMLP